jgi:hypothetical protein
VCGWVRARVCVHVSVCVRARLCVCVCVCVMGEFGVSGVEGRGRLKIVDWKLR